MKPMHMQDPWVFIRKTLENAFDKGDEETVRRMSAMIDRGMLCAAADDDGHAAGHAECAENA